MPKKQQHTKLLEYENIKCSESFDLKNWRCRNLIKEKQLFFIKEQWSGANSSKSLKCIFTIFWRQASAGLSWQPSWPQSLSAGPASSHPAPAFENQCQMMSRKGLPSPFPSHSRYPKDKKQFSILRLLLLSL